MRPTDARRPTVRGLGRRASLGAATVALLVGACSSGPGTAAPDDDLGKAGNLEAIEAEVRVSGDVDDEVAVSGGVPEPGDRDRAAGLHTDDPPPPPASRPQVVATAHELFDGLRASVDDDAGEAFGVLVVDEHGRELLAHRPDAAMLPASTLKIVTAAAALTTFGRDATFTTTVEVTGPIRDDGTLDGDLVLTGSGDPVLATERFGRFIYPARPRTPLEDLAEQLVGAGLRRVEGDLVAVADRFDVPTRPEGWPDRYYSSFDARNVAGLTVDAGLRTIVSWPDPEQWAELDADELDAIAAALELDELDPELLDNGEVEPDLDLLDPLDPPDGLEPDVRIEHAEDPAEQAAAELVRLLAERDIEVDGTVVIDTERPPVVGRVGRVDSPPMSELLAFALRRSDNHLTDAIFVATGRARTGTGSFTSGERALRQTLDRFGIDHDGAVFADGSGLSRDDRSSARLLVEVERALLRSRHAAVWRDARAVMGESGTLSQRLRGTIAQGRFAGKTGTLRDVTGLVGSVEGTDGRRYHLAVLANDPGQGRWLAQRFADELAVLLTADLDGCDVGLGDDGDGPLGLPPLAIAC